MRTVGKGWQGRGEEPACGAGGQGIGGIQGDRRGMCPRRGGKAGVCMASEHLGSVAISGGSAVLPAPLDITVTSSGKSA